MIVIEKGKSYNVSIKENGDKFWYLDNQLHREEGPAVELKSGASAYYLKGVKQVSAAQHQKNLRNASAPVYYDVVVETMVPTTMIYRVLAKSPEEAALAFKNQTPTRVVPRPYEKRDIKLQVRDAGTNFIRFMKNLVGA